MSESVKVVIALVFFVAVFVFIRFGALKFPRPLGAVGLALLAIGQVLGLTVTPAEQHMGEVGRILYVHVPTAWMCLVAYTYAFVAALAVVFLGPSADSRTSYRVDWDGQLIGAIEAGVVLNALLLMQGMLWARPTWGVFWTWDEPRLTSSLILCVMFAGLLILRQVLTSMGDVDRRALVTGIATIPMCVGVPVVYYSVRWWRSIHQMQSTPETIDPTMVWVLRLNAFAVLFLMIGWIGARAHIETKSTAKLLAPLLPPRPATGGAA